MKLKWAQWRKVALEHGLGGATLHLFFVRLPRGCITVESIAPLDYEDLVEECQMKKMHAKLLLKRARELGNF